MRVANGSHFVLVLMLLECCQQLHIGFMLSICYKKKQNGNVEKCLFHQQEMGFTKEQSSNALILHGTVEKALESLSGLSGMIILDNKTCIYHGQKLTFPLRGCICPLGVSSWNYRNYPL